MWFFKEFASREVWRTEIFEEKDKSERYKYEEFYKRRCGECTPRSDVFGEVHRAEGVLPNHEWAVAH